MSFSLVSFLVRGGSISSESASIIITPEEQSEGIESLSSSPSIVTAKSTLEVKKRNGSIEPLKKEKLQKRLDQFTNGLDLRYIQTSILCDKIIRGLYPFIPTKELDVLASETSATMSTQHPDYARLAARICISSNHKTTRSNFTQAMAQIVSENEEDTFLSPQLIHILQKRGKEIDNYINHDRDFLLSYFGYKTLEKSYLLKDRYTQEVVERPQYMFMRVALGIHCTSTTNTTLTDKEESIMLQNSFATYDHLSQGYFMHASPTLFHSGTTYPQLSSCFLVQMSDDSIHGIYSTLMRCALISKAAGGIGLSVHNIRSRGSFIKGTRGVSNGLVPMLRVYDVTSRYVDQGGGKRPGAFAIYIEPWHSDIFDVLNLKKNHGKEEQRARDLFYGLWVPDLFMKRVQNNEMWSLMCPHSCPGLHLLHGKEFEDLYQTYEQTEGKVVRTVRARELWSAILDSQIETGTPYMLYKDAANAKSNQQNLGTIQCSNLCTEIIQYTDSEEVAVCNLASLCLPKFVVSPRGPYGSPTTMASSQDENSYYFDHDALHRATKIVTRNLNKIIDINHYPMEGAKKSNTRHRPIGIGVSGLADVFIRLGLPFTSDGAKALNKAIFETIYHASLEASAELAERDGPYETFPGSPASKGLLQYHLWGVDEADLPSRQQQLNNGKDNRTIVQQKYPAAFQGVGYNWEELRDRIQKNGLRNSLLVAPMPTASTSQILGVNECFEPYVSNLYLRRVKSGEFIMANSHLLADLTDRGLWNAKVRNQLMRDGGSVANISCIPDKLKQIYKTVWEIKMKDIIDMSADRGIFIDQSQSLNLFMSDPSADKLTAMHFYSWKKGLKTGMYYLRTRPAVNAIQYTVDGAETSEISCPSCQA